MVKHTPGPWHYDDGQGGKYFPIVKLGGPPDSPHGITINDCRGKNGGDIHELQANARLIAAAPALLDALESLALMTEASELHDMAQIARAAIAIAEPTP